MRMPRLVVSVAIASIVVLAGCAPLPDPTPAPTETSTSSPTVAPEPTPTETTADNAFTVPGSCEDIFSASMRQALEAQNPPLNDPAITMYSTEQVPGLEILASGVPTLRCTWGAAGGPGLATNVSAIDVDDQAVLQDALAGAGMSCEPYAEGVLCRISSETIDREDNVVRTGETHYLREDAWVSTHWINFSPEGYTEDIVATLWP